MSMAEPLTLLLSPESLERAERTGTPREFTFDACDGSIGRSDDCDWTLGADGVSRVHAFVRHLNGLYFVEDRSTNGMLINGAPMRKGDPAALKHGDRLQIDVFDIEVHLHAPALSAPSNTVASTVSNAVSNTVSNAVSNEPEVHESLIPGATGAGTPGASLDPLALFDAPSSLLDASWVGDSPAPAWNHTPAVSDRFRPPAPESDRVNASLLPEDWNATHIEAQRQISAASETPSEPRQQAQAETQLEPQVEPQVEPQASAQIEAQREPHVDKPSETLPVTHPHVDAPIETPFDDTSGSTSMTSSQTSTPPIHEYASHDRRSEAAATESEAASAVSHRDELMPLLIVAVDAMMDVLRARAELKNSFRLPATLIQRSENNPLKFAPTAQDAVAKLLTASDSGFLSGRAALDDAADDIRNHQMAMLAGVRSAFDGLLAQFDPARIEEQAESTSRRLSLGARPRHWERYKAQFEALTRNPDECFRRLFGDEFARAYEAQLSRLKTRRD